MMAQRQNRAARTPSKTRRTDGTKVEDTAIRSLSKDEIKRMSIDAWEPSLLRHMLEAQNKLRRR